MEAMVSGIETVANIASELISKGENVKIWTFSGELGAGKTTLIKEVCRQLGVKEAVKSPSFNIVHEYRNIGDETIFHFDFYRINDLSEAEDLGLDDYFFSGSLCLIEWPEMAGSLIPDPAIHVKIEHSNEGNRHYYFYTNEQKNRI